MTSTPKSDETSSAPYEVGYKKPPVATRFKKGQSGNPSGRPKGSKVKPRTITYELPEETLKETFLQEAYRLININTGQGEESIPIAQAVIRALGVKAAKGHIQAQRLFATTLIAIEAEKRANADEQMDRMIEYKRSWSKELKRRAKEGLPIDPPVPHPDDLHIDITRGTLEVRGPLTPEEKERRDFYTGLLEDWRATRDHYEAVLARPAEHDIEIEHRKFFEEELAQCRKIIPMLEILSGQTEETLTIFEANKRKNRIE